MVKSAAVLLLFALSAAADDPHIGTIDFYGYTGLDRAQLEKVLPYHVGDPLPSGPSMKAAAQVVESATRGRKVRLSHFCCEDNGRWALFVGIEEPDAPPLVFLPKPHGTVRLPAELDRLLQDVDRAQHEAVMNGKAGEDDSHGYSLSEYPPARALELKIHEYARTHTALLMQVLETSAVDDQRAGAAEALGYADESKEQVAALARASLDSNDDVRNNATRALGVLAGYDPKIASQIRLEPYIALMHSLDWTDRNKGAALLDSLTKSRDPEVLKTVRAGALTPLREMAQWRSFGHAGSAIFILSRMAGWDENRMLQAFVNHDVTELLAAVQK